MVYDYFQNISIYKNLHKNFSLCIDFLKNNDLSKLKKGKYELLGENLYYVVTEYNTQEPSFFEAHKEYIDFQFLISGKERVDFHNVDECSVCVPYDKKTDSVLLSTGCFSSLQLSTNQFVIFFPSDAHRPCLKIKDTEKIIKIIFKIRI